MTDAQVFEYKTAAYYTLGCKLNFAETSTIGRSLLAQGIRTAQAGERADICVINTCSVTELADKKCRYMIRRARREHPGAFIVVTGCYAQLGAEEIASIDGVNLVLGSDEKLDTASWLSQLSTLGTGEVLISHTATEDITTFYPGISSDERTRYFLKVQDGCNYQCSYCTIPKARGRSRNGSISSLVQQAKQIAQEGGLEIVLTGVNIGDFGRTTGERFVDLVRALDEVESIQRFRISSIEPNLLSDEVIEICARSRAFVPHFHLPLQSGSNEVLRLMRRRYTSELFARRLEAIKSIWPQAFIGVDMIVGTRGETEELFEESYEFIAAQPFSQLHIFTYSEREGTTALQIPHIVPPRDKHKRSQRLIKLSEEHLRAFYQENIGRAHRVIWEMGNQDGWMTGLSDNYVRIAKPYDASSVGQIEWITPEALHETGKFLI